MSVTIGNIISRVRTTLKANAYDDFITDRYIWSIVSKHVSATILRYIGQLSVVESPDLYITVHGIRLEDVSKIQDCSLELGSAFCNSMLIKRSINKLPPIRAVNGKYLIRGVYSLDRSLKFQQTTVSKLSNMINSRYYKYVSDVYYFIDNSYLYIANADIPAVVIEASFQDVYDYYSSCDEHQCVRAQDLPLGAPEQLLAEIEGNALKEIFTMLQIPENNDMGDNKMSLHRPSE